MARYDLDGTPNPAQSYDPSHNFSGTGSQVPDGVGYGNLATPGEKSQSDAYKWTWGAGAGSKIALTPSDLSQMEWVDGDDIAVTFAGGTASCGTSYQGKLGIVSRSAGSLSTSISVDLIGANQTAKPEGVDVVEIDASRDSCRADTTHVIYVTDYCQDELFVYEWDGSTIRLADNVTLDDASLTGKCRPSSVRYHSWSAQVIAACQTRGSLVFLDAADQCTPSWTPSTDDAPVQYYSSGSNPSCSNTPTTTACTSTTSCELHDIGFDDDIAPGWIFTNLTTKGEVVAMRATGTHFQVSFYRDAGGTYDPLEIELGSNP